MEDKNKHQPTEGDHKNIKTGNKAPNDVLKAHHEADKDISKDPDWSAKSPNDDLDEGESARLGEHTSGII
ncbi:MAG: hypothetical protein ABI415_10640 [Flavitalea sp.]